MHCDVQCQQDDHCRPLGQLASCAVDDILNPDYLCADQTALKYGNRHVIGRRIGTGLVL